MCLPDFKGFRQVSVDEPLIGYRAWKNLINDDSLVLMSENQNYEWKKNEGIEPHEVLDIDSGLYAYNYNNYNNNYYYNYNYYNYNYNYNNYNNYYYNYNNYNNYYYNLYGIIKQWGKTAIHSTGQRSEFASIEKLFTIRESDADGPKVFLDWISKFNKHIEAIAERYNATTIHWQDFIESKK